MTTEQVDILPLLLLLAQDGKTGVFHAYTPEGLFQGWLERGRVRYMGLGPHRGNAALVAVLRHPTLHFHFDEGLRYPNAYQDQPLDEVLLDVLDEVTTFPVTIQGAAWFTRPERLQQLRWTRQEHAILDQIEAGKPLRDIGRTPQARQFLGKLCRLDFLAPRRSRMVRLVVRGTRNVRNVVLIDEGLHATWQQELRQVLTHITVRTDSGYMETLPVRGVQGLGEELLIPPELMNVAQFRAGDRVMVRPA